MRVPLPRSGDSGAVYYVQEGGRRVAVGVHHAGGVRHGVGTDISAFLLSNGGELDMEKLPLVYQSKLSILLQHLLLVLLMFQPQNKNTLHLIYLIHQIS